MSISKKQTQYVAVAISIIVTVLFVGIALVRAHGSGASFEKQVDDVLIDVGYSVEEFSTDSSVVFDFGLKDSTETKVLFTDVWVRIVKDTSTVFATGVHNARLGGAIMTYTFSESGNYELSVRYQNDGESVAAAVFPLSVEKSSNGKGDEISSLKNLILGFLGVLLVVIFIILGMRKNRNKVILHE